MPGLVEAVVVSTMKLSELSVVMEKMGTATEGLRDGTSAQLATVGSRVARIGEAIAQPDSRYSPNEEDIASLKTGLQLLQTVVGIPRQEDGCRKAPSPQASIIELLTLAANKPDPKLPMPHTLEEIASSLVDAMGSEATRAILREEVKKVPAPASLTVSQNFAALDSYGFSELTSNSLMSPLLDAVKKIYQAVVVQGPDGEAPSP